MNLLSASRSSARIHSLLRALLLFVVWSAPLSAAVYYVDYAAGIDTAAGTATTAAWKHCPGDPAAVGAAAAAVLVPGDTVRFKGGVNYVLTGATGIVVRWNGTVASPIIYDGNSAGTWGAGRARFTDNHGANARIAFVAPSAAANLVFQHLEFVAIGGSATLPADGGVAVGARSGGGIAFKGGVVNARIENCLFRDLGYAFAAKPMSAASVQGAGISASSANALKVLNCEFSRVAVGIDLRAATAVTATEIGQCAFGDALVWSVSLPPKHAGVSNLSVHHCTETKTQMFETSGWAGYGAAPRLKQETVVAGATVTFHASAVATPDLAFQWTRNGVALAGATQAALTLAAVEVADAGTYTVVATNPSGATTSNEAVLTVIAPPPPAPATQAPTFLQHPVSQSAAPLTKITLTAVAAGEPAPTYRWYRNGVTFPTWNQPSLTLSAVTSNDVGTYVVVATNSAGTVTSNAAKVALASPPATSTPTAPTTTTPSSNTSSGSVTLAIAPVITQQPVSQLGAPAGTVTFSAAANGSPAPTYQWFHDGVPLPGATSATLRLDGLSAAHAGVYRMTAQNAAGTATSANATLTLSAVPLDSVGKPPANEAPVPVVPTPPAPAAISHVVNMSVRSTTGAGSESLIVGFVVAGGEKPLLIRGNGPALAAFGIEKPVNDPSLALYAGARRIMENRDWNTSAEGSAVAVTARTLGAFAWSEQSRDAALLATVPAGVYTAHVSGDQGADGIALVELYDASPNDTSRLVNISARTIVSDTNAPIIGFVVAGNAPKRLLVRAIGPGLAGFGVEGVLSNPQIEIFRNAASVQKNDNWGGTAELAAVFEQVGAFPLTDAASQDAAAIFVAQPGVYTVVVTGVGASRGTVLVEVYDVP